MSTPEAAEDDRDAVIEAMFARGATVNEVVAQFPDMDLQTLLKRAAYLIDPFENYLEEDTEPRQALVRSTVQCWIDGLYETSPGTAVRLDLELNPELEDEIVS